MTEQQQYNRRFFNQLHGEHNGDALMQAMESICPDYVDMTMDFAFGQIFSRKNLNIKTRELIVISLCVALGDMPDQLKAHIEAALNCGVSKQECVEAILQVVLYAGFARVTNALILVKDLLGEWNA